LVAKVNEKIKTAGGLEALKAGHVDLLCETITEMIKGGDRVQLQGFGSFHRRVAAAREARNPKTGEKIHVPAKVRLDFQATVAAFELSDEEKKEKGPVIRVVAEQLLLEVVTHDEDKRPYGHSYEEILNRIRAQFEGAKTTVACLRWYAVHMRERGEKVPNRPRATLGSVNFRGQRFYSQVQVCYRSHDGTA
jgi:DNA-binding protein HU-beta